MELFIFFFSSRSFFPSIFVLFSSVYMYSFDFGRDDETRKRGRCRRHGRRLVDWLRGWAFGQNRIPDIWLFLTTMPSSPTIRPSMPDEMESIVTSSIVKSSLDTLMATILPHDKEGMPVWRPFAAGWLSWRPDQDGRLHLLSERERETDTQPLQWRMRSINWKVCRLIRQQQQQQQQLLERVVTDGPIFLRLRLLDLFCFVFHLSSILFFAFGWLAKKEIGSYRHERKKEERNTGQMVSSGERSSSRWSASTRVPTPLGSRIEERERDEEKGEWGGRERAESIESQRQRRRRPTSNSV